MTIPVGDCAKYGQGGHLTNCKCSTIPKLYSPPTLKEITKEEANFKMGYMLNGLTFRTLRDASVKRLPFFKDKNGRRAHSKKDGSDWSPASWLQAVIGELGEYANLRKKVERGDYTLDEVKDKLASELADVIIYLDLLAFQLGIDLGDAVMKTWNAKAEQLDIPMYIDAEDWHFNRTLTEEEIELAK